MFCSVIPLLDDEEYRNSQLSEDEKAMLEDYAAFPYLRETIDKLRERQKGGSKAEAKSKDTQADESKA